MAQATREAEASSGQLLQTASRARRHVPRPRPPRPDAATPPERDAPGPLQVLPHRGARAARRAVARAPRARSGLPRTARWSRGCSGSRTLEGRVARGQAAGYRALAHAAEDALAAHRDEADLRPSPGRTDESCGCSTRWRPPLSALDACGRRRRRARGRRRPRERRSAATRSRIGVACADARPAGSGPCASTARGGRRIVETALGRASTSARCGWQPRGVDPRGSLGPRRSARRVGDGGGAVRLGACAARRGPPRDARRRRSEASRTVPTRRSARTPRSGAPPTGCGSSPRGRSSGRSSRRPGRRAGPRQGVDVRRVGGGRFDVERTCSRRCARRSCTSSATRSRTASSRRRSARRAGSPPAGSGSRHRAPRPPASPSSAATMAAGWTSRRYGGRGGAGVS